MEGLGVDKDNLLCLNNPACCYSCLLLFGILTLKYLFPTQLTDGNTK